MLRREPLFGGMIDSWKVIDFRRDPHFAVHGPTFDAAAWSGDAKVSGRAVEVVLSRLGDPPDHLVVESRQAGRGLRRTERR